MAGQRFKKKDERESRRSHIVKLKKDVEFANKLK